MTEKKPNIVLAPQDEIAKFPAGEARFLRLVDLEGALITDESTVGDFNPSRGHYRTLTQAVGYIVSAQTLVWKLCRDLQR